MVHIDLAQPVVSVVILTEAVYNLPGVLVSRYCCTWCTVLGYVGCGRTEGCVELCSRAHGALLAALLALSFCVLLYSCVFLCCS